MLGIFMIVYLIKFIVFWECDVWSEIYKILTELWLAPSSSFANKESENMKNFDVSFSSSEEVWPPTAIKRSCQGQDEGFSESWAKDKS